MKPASVVLSLLLGVGCVPRVIWHLQEQLDEGVACVQGGGDDPVLVKVNAGLCLSGSCSRQLESSCEAVIDDDRIVVTSTFVWEEARGRRLLCTMDCQMMLAECSPGDLPPGTYTLVHGDDEISVDLPLERCDPDF